MEFWHLHDHKLKRKVNLKEKNLRITTNMPNSLKKAKQQENHLQGHGETTEDEKLRNSAPNALRKYP